MGDGEEARLTPGALGEAEVWSRGFLPLRVRSEGVRHLRPAFPGTAVALGAHDYEVLSETERPGDGLVLYRLRRWPDGEVVRDRVVYGQALVGAAEEERDRARVRESARPFRWLLYPLVGLLPEGPQERLCDRLGLYAVTATLVSGLAESLGMAVLISLACRTSEPGRAIAFVTLAPGLALFILPGLGRAFGAAALREVGGSPPVVAVHSALRALGAARGRLDRTCVPLTRQAFWERLRLPDAVEREKGGSLVHRGLLPHLTWHGGRRLQGGDDFWSVLPLPPLFDRGRLVYGYRLTPLGDPPARGEPPPVAPAPTAYGDEVLEEVAREWDSVLAAFSWLVSLLSEAVQARAFAHIGGPAAARRPTLVTAIVGALLGVYILSFLPGPPGDPLAPFLGIAGVALLVDAVRRLLRRREGRYAPSLFRFLLPSDSLRPERIAFHAHRDAEETALRQTERG